MFSYGTTQDVCVGVLLKSSKVKGHDANRKPMGRFESDMFESNIVSLAIL